MNQHELKALAIELAAAMPPVSPEDEELKRHEAWDTANALSTNLHNLSSVLLLLGDAHRLQHQHQEQVSEHIWGNAFEFLNATVEHASDQVEEILRGAFRRPPNAFNTAENQ